MIHSVTVEAGECLVKSIWEVVPRGDVPTQSAGLYVSINPNGYINFNRKVYERLRSPKGVLLLFDRLNSRIALKPSELAKRNTYPVRAFGRNGGKVVRALRLLIEYGIKIPELLEFKDVEIDQDGYLVLDLRTAQPSKRGKKGVKGFPKKAEQRAPKAVSPGTRGLEQLAAR